MYYFVFIFRFRHQLTVLLHVTPLTLLHSLPTTLLPIPLLPAVFSARAFFRSWASQRWASLLPLPYRPRSRRPRRNLRIPL
jgi:hypothetical protein